MTDIFRSCSSLQRFVARGPDRSGPHAGTAWLPGALLQQLFALRESHCCELVCDLGIQPFVAADQPFVAADFCAGADTLTSLTIRQCSVATIPRLALLTALQRLVFSQDVHPDGREADRGSLAALAPVLPRLTRLRELEVGTSDEPEQAPVWRLPSSVTSFKLSGHCYAIESPPRTRVELYASGLHSVECVFTDASLRTVLESNKSLAALFSVLQLPPLSPETCALLLKQRSLVTLRLWQTIVPASFVTALPSVMPGLAVLDVVPRAIHPLDATAVLAALPQLQDCILTHADSRDPVQQTLPASSSQGSLPKLKQLCLHQCATTCCFACPCRTCTR